MFDVGSRFFFFSNIQRGSEVDGNLEGSPLVDCSCQARGSCDRSDRTPSDERRCRSGSFNLPIKQTVVSMSAGHVIPSRLRHVFSYYAASIRRTRGRRPRHPGGRLKGGGVEVRGLLWHAAFRLFLHVPLISTHYKGGIIPLQLVPSYHRGSVAKGKSAPS